MKWKIIIGLIVLLVIVVIARPELSRRLGEQSLVATTTPNSNLSAPELMTVKVFFGNRRDDPGSLYCERAYPTPREVAKTDATAEAALTELLAGPTEAEKAQGFFTALNSGVTLQSFSVKDGVAKADFSSRLGEGVGGSCMVTAIRAQISETIKQFPSVDSVVISINGQSEDILQP